MSEPEPRHVLGPDPRVASLAAYSAWWVSGGLVWLLEQDRPDVRFHAMQSLLAFGFVFLAWMTCWIGSFLALVVWAGAFFFLQRLAEVVLLAGIIVWGVCLLQTARGIRLELPLFGRLAERANRRLTSPRSNPPAQG